MNQINELFNSAIAKARLYAGWLVLFSINSLGTCVIAALTGVEWESLSHQKRFLIVVAIGVNWTGHLMALFKQVVSNGGSTLPDEPASPAKVLNPSP